MVGFYVVAPALIAFLHINLLSRLILLARDIYERDGGEKIDDGKAHANGEVRSDDKTPKDRGIFDAVLTMLFPTDPERHMSAMREAVPATIFLSIGFLVQVAVPILVLLVLQSRFSLTKMGRLHFITNS